MPRNPNQARYYEWRAPDGEVYPMRDLPHGTSFVLHPVADDLEHAVPTDPNNCALAQCAIRESDGLPAQIGVDKARIPRYDGRGRPVVWRCRVPKATLDAINRFDATGELPRGGFEFTGIPPSARIDSQRSQDKRRRERWGHVRGQSGERRKHLYLRNAARKAATS